MTAWFARMDGAERLGVALLAGFFWLACALPLAVSLAVSPEAIERGEVQLSPPCAIRASTGVDCATCGMTRGFCAMSRLRVGDAADYNGAAPWLWLLTLLGLLGSSTILVRVGASARSGPRAVATTR